MLNDINESTKLFEQCYRGDKLEKIRARNGGSLMEIFDKVKASETPTLIVGLGGLGCRTVNIVKQKYLTSISDGEKLGEDKKIHFLAIDTDYNNTLKKLIKNESDTGWLESDEIHSLIRSGVHAHLIGALLRDPEGTHPEQTWIDEGLNPNTVLDNNGAQGIRQVGRVGLSIKENYDALMSRIKEKMQNMQAVASNDMRSVVILIAGISGGTGSGTIVDVSYLIRRTAADVMGNAPQFDAILYTPDVQEQNPNIDPELLQRNFTAAMKEIDTFFKASENKAVYTFARSDNPEGKYSQRAANGRRVSDHDLFSSCTLVQGYDSAGNVMKNAESIAMDTVASYVVNMIGDFTADGQDPTIPAGMTVQTLAAVLDNERNNAEHGANTVKSTYQHYPRDYSYHYRAIGFRCLNYPVGALMTYLANSMTVKLCEEFDKHPKYDPWKILMAANLCNANTVRNKKLCFEGIFSLGKNSGIMRSMQYDIEFRTLRNRDTTLSDLGITAPPQFDSSWVDEVVDVLVEWLEKEMKYQKDGNGGNGPFAAIRLSTKLIDYLREFYSAYKDNTVKNYYEELVCVKRAELERKLKEIQNENIVASGVNAIVGQNKKIAAQFNDDLRQYMIVWWKSSNLDKAANALSRLINGVISKNVEIWQFAVGAFLAVADIMEKDSTAAIDAAVERNKGDLTFSKDMLNLSELNETNTNLHKLLERFIDPERVKKLCQDLVQDMLNQRNAWTKSDANFDAVDHIRKIFQKQFAEFTESQLEKLLIVQYAKLDNKLTLEQLLSYMEQYLDTPTPGDDKWKLFEDAFTAIGVESPIKLAAEQIYKEAISIGKCAAIDPGIAGGPTFTNLYTDRRLCLNEHTPQINKKIRSMAAENLLIYTGSYPGVFCSEVSCGVPLFFFKSMSRNQEAYTKALHTSGSSNAGLHMDANKKTGWIQFPPLITNDVLRIMDPDNLATVMNRQDYRDERAILENIKMMADYCMHSSIGLFNMHKKDPSNPRDVDYYILSVLADVVGKDAVRACHDTVCKNVHEAVLAAVSNVGDIDPFEKDPKAKWNDMFRNVYKRPSIYQLMLDANYPLEPKPVNLSLPCPMLEMINCTANGKGDIDKHNEAGLYRTIRRSEEYRRKLRLMYDEATRLEKDVESIIEELCTPVREVALQTAEKAAQTSALYEKAALERIILELFIKAIITQNIKITFDDENFVLNADFYYDLENPTDFQSLIVDLHMQGGAEYEKLYEVYGVYTEFLVWVRSMEASDREDLARAVNQAFVKNSNRSFMTTVALERAVPLISYRDYSDLFEITNKQMTLPMPGAPQRNKCKVLDAEYARSLPCLFMHLTETHLYDEKNGTGFGAQLLGYYASAAEILKKLNLEPFAPKRETRS